VLSPGVVVRESALVEDCVLMDGVNVGPGAVVRRAILDKNVIVPPGYHLGTDAERDGRRFKVSGRGVLAIGKGEAIGSEE
jgi:glucose-1-phosphate adenylyltransferase